MRIVFLPVLLAVLFGCGQKGALYLPPPEANPAVTAPAAVPPAASEEKKK